MKSAYTSWKTNQKSSITTKNSKHGLKSSAMGGSPFWDQTEVVNSPARRSMNTSKRPALLGTLQSTTLLHPTALLNALIIPCLMALEPCLKLPNCLVIYGRKQLTIVMSKGKPQGLKGFNRFISYKLRIGVSLFCNKQKWSYDQPLSNIQRLRHVDHTLCHYSPRVMRVNPKGLYKGQNVGILELIF